MWVLIVFALWGGSAGVTSDDLQEFDTEKLCEDAKKALMLGRPTGNMRDTRQRMFCEKKPEPTKNVPMSTEKKPI